MSDSTQTARAEVERFMHGLVRRNPGEREFHQAVREVAEAVLPFIREHPRYAEARILERMTEPDRIVIFRVTWEDREGSVRANRAWRVQFNNAIGPYKGGMRFHPGVTQSVLKFLGFEQVFKNSLTGLSLGGAKGGANFNPRGKTDREVMRFCQSLMIELHRHIGEDVDIPAGDIGVGTREISYMFGQHKRLSNRFSGTLTGKGLAFGGSPIRREATGYGAVYFAEQMLGACSEGLEGKRVSVSGSGNVALYCIEMLARQGARVLTASDSDGFIYDPDGIRDEKLAWLQDLKERRRGRVREYAEQFPGTEYHAGRSPWSVPADLAFPCATENELDEADARCLLDNGVIAVVEGANMPCTPAAAAAFLKARIRFGPGKAANAGGVAVSGLEQSQNAMRLTWTEAEVCRRLRGIMEHIHSRCVEYGRDRGGYIHYPRGANIAGFVKVADAMLAQGIL